MKHLSIILVSLFILFNGCSSLEDKVKTAFNGEEIKGYVNEAISGNESSNIKLSDLYDYSLPLPLRVNKILIDSIKTNSGKVLFIVLAEHENPVFNRLAIYDKGLRLLLMDKSLNGYLAFSVKELNNKNIVVLNEQFTSKDTLKLERVSFYLVSDSGAVLCFRSFTGMLRGRKEFKQAIDEISEESIKTSMSGPAGSPINNKSDAFIFDEALQKYNSSSDVFNKYIIEEVRNYSKEVTKPQITDIRSAMESIGAVSGNGEDTITNTSNFGAEGFGLTLNETWKELRNVSISSYINTEFKGTRYINNNIGASIYVIPLAAEDSAEMYIDPVLDQKSEGKYKVRYGNKIESGKNFIQYFEYSCGGKKFLLILETSKYTYGKYKQTYSDIISTFYMEC